MTEPTSIHQLCNRRCEHGISTVGWRTSNC